METPPSPKVAVVNSYFELVILLIAGTAAAIFISWALSNSFRFFPGVKIPPIQTLIMSAFPVLAAVARWSAGQVTQLKQTVDANSLQLSELKEAKETIVRLDREVLWNKIQIENLYSKLDELRPRE